jgi:hypothetical protein
VTHPYENMRPEAYWKTAVAEPGAYGLSGLWTPKFAIKPNQPIVTAGSCFAQHIGNALAERGYLWTDCEAAPPFLPSTDTRKFGYGIFSFRTGNIYTPSMLLQWLELAYGAREEIREVWEEGGRYYDPLRPAIEPGGFASEDEVWAARRATYAALRRAIETAQVFVFTLGLTERWHNRETGLEYALCPGTVAGDFDPDLHVFTNSNTRATERALVRAIRFARSKNPKLKVLLTVSPVPLTATASDAHVLMATQYSKSVLRAVAGMAAAESRHIDYFPSFEIITHPIFRGMFFAPNMRSVVPEGVATVMKHFFADQVRVFGEPKATIVKKKLPVTSPTIEKEIECEEELLNAFAT